jgi:hypothetical protein
MRLGDGIERQAASLGHAGTLPNTSANSRQWTAAPQRAHRRRYARGVEVLISEEARDYIADHGGTVFVRSHPHRCCSGSLTLLDVRMTPPRDVADFEPFDTGGVGVRFRAGSGSRPDQLTIALRGWPSRRPVAFWDGCALKPS